MKTHAETPPFFQIYAMVKCGRCGVSGPGILQVSHPYTRQVSYLAVCRPDCSSKPLPTMKGRHV